MSNSSTEAFSFTGVATGNTAQFTIKGGVYALIATGTITAAAANMLSADGSTFAPVGTGLTAAGVLQPLYLPAGQCRLSVTVTGNAALTLARVSL